MRITFDPDFENGCWPGPLGARKSDSVPLSGRTKCSDNAKPSAPTRTAAIGEIWVGPARLQGILETALGLGGLFPSQSERTAALARAVRTQEGFWSASAEKDPISVARTLLRWIDWLRFHGWEGQIPAAASASDRAPAHKPRSPSGRESGSTKPSTPASPNLNRLYDLSRLLPLALPGVPDRLHAIAAALDKRRTDIESVDTFEPVDCLLPLWRKIFVKLEARGVAIRHSLIPPVSSKRATDLRRCLSPDFAPSNDDSLILFRPYSLMDAAESVAAWLRAQTDISEILIISPDVVLDEALRRFGLPVTGAKETTNDDPLLQVLPLVLAMGWDPPDPQRVLELLIIPDGPIPGFLARALRSALQQWPAVGSPSWNDALATGLDALPPAARRDSVRNLLDAIFRPDAAIRTAFPSSALKLRAQVVRKWAAVRRFAAEGPPEMVDRLDAVIGQCNLFERLIELSGFGSLTEPQLLRLVRELTDSTGPHRRYAPEAGISVVNSPAAVAGPARHIIWWDFTLESAPEPFSIPLSRAELAALESAGVPLTPAADIASDHSRRWRRPFAQASETLLLACPMFGEDGEERHHHPLWDEVTANLKKGTARASLEARTLNHAARSKKRRDALLPIPRPRRSWSVRASMVSPARSHSPSSMESLIGCPFKWVLTYLGKLLDPEIAALTDNGTMLGTLSHEILAETLRSNPADGLTAQKTADDLFVRLGPKLAAPLFLPGAPFQISFARKATADAARVLVDHLKRSELPIVGVEIPVSKKLGALEFNGRTDLVVGDPPVVLDLKWSGAPRNRDKLKNGTAFQVAAYAFMLQTGRAFPAAAYFILRDQRLIALKNVPFTNAETIEGPPLQETWNALLATTRESLDLLTKGRIEALGIQLEDDTGGAKKDELSDGRLTLEPPCKFCSFGFLCGRTWGDVR
jgi:hypothetical protein